MSDFDIREGSRPSTRRDRTHTGPAGGNPAQSNAALIEELDTRQEQDEGLTGAGAASWLPEGLDAATAMGLAGVRDDVTESASDGPQGPDDGMGSNVEPEGSAPAGWGEAMTTFMGVTAYSNGGYGNWDFAPGWAYEEYGYEFQCVEFVNRFGAQVLGVGNMRGSGHAKDYAGREIPGLQWVPNGQGTAPPQAGDIIVFYGGDYGHIGIAAGGTAQAVELVHQNWGDNGQTTIPVQGEAGAVQLSSLGSYAVAGWHSTGGSIGEGEAGIPAADWTRQRFMQMMAGVLGFTAKGGDADAVWAEALDNGMVTQDTPGDPITRLAAASILARGLGLDAVVDDATLEDPSQVASFTDVRQGDDFFEVAMRCRATGIFNGGSDNSFRAHDELTQQEAGYLLEKAAKTPAVRSWSDQTAHLDSPPLQVDSSHAADIASSEQVITDLNDQTYAHGGYMGLAGSLLTDAKWMAILQAIDPGLYADIQALCADIGLSATEALQPGFILLAAEPTDQSALEETMLDLENHPVMAAYGFSRDRGLLWNSGDLERTDRAKGHGDTALEWDVWLSPEDPGNMDAARIYHGTGGELTISSAVTAEAFGHGEDAKDEVEELYGGVKSRGYESPSDVFQQEGVQAGRTGTDWMSGFGRAVDLYMHGGIETQDVDGQTAMATDILSQIGVYLDIKSPATSDDINTFIKAVEADGQGIDVIGVGAFYLEQIYELCDGVTGLLFFNSVDNVINAFNDDALTELSARALEAPMPGPPYGPLGSVEGVTANLGDLIKTGALGLGKPAINEDRLADLRAIKTALPWLGIGGYVQETAIGADELQLLVELVNTEPELFDLGFAFGGVSGVAETTTEGKGQGGQWILDVSETGDRLTIPDRRYVDSTYTV